MRLPRWCLLLARCIVVVLAAFLLAACNPPVTQISAPGAAPDSNANRAVARLILSGNAAYAEKRSYESFIRSLKYYDSALVIAERSGDTLLLANAIFAKGRVYDAWNKEPQKTIRLFTQAAAYLKTIPAEKKRYLYVKHLVAHAYDKIKDSTHATAILRDMYRELAGKDTALLHALTFIPEMALIATEVRAYPLADSILHLTRRNWIFNDTLSYDYLSHYYLTQSRLDVYYRRPTVYPYLDSLEAAYQSSRNLLDRQYYSDALAGLYRATGQYRKSSDFYAVNKQHDDSIDNRADVGNMQSALLQSELLAETRKAEYEEALRTNRLHVIWLLSSLLSIITALSFYLYRQGTKSRRQAHRLARVNSDLDERITQVELLNKEIQHRVKNNLHMIYSLLHMQERKTDSDEVIAALQAARLRVESVAALHNQLLAGKGSLHLADFIKTLITSVVNCLSDDINVVTHITTDEIKISEDNYFELSLILNEWVTNSIKYAVPPGQLLEIDVSVKQTEYQVCIEYRDSGSTNGQQPGTPGLGTQIIHLLSLQMGAQLTTINGRLYHYQLCIPDGK